MSLKQKEEKCMDVIEFYIGDALLKLHQADRKAKTLSINRTKY